MKLSQLSLMLKTKSFAQETNWTHSSFAQKRPGLLPGEAEDLVTIPEPYAVLSNDIVQVCHSVFVRFTLHMSFENLKFVAIYRSRSCCAEYEASLYFFTRTWFDVLLTISWIPISRGRMPGYWWTFDLATANGGTKKQHIIHTNVMKRPPQSIVPNDQASPADHMHFNASFRFFFPSASHCFVSLFWFVYLWFCLLAICFTVLLTLEIVYVCRTGTAKRA